MADNQHFQSSWEICQPLCENSAGSRIKTKFSNYLLYFQICPECSSFCKQVYVIYKHFLFELEEHRYGNVLQSYIDALRCFLEVNLQSSTVVWFARG